MSLTSMSLTSAHKPGDRTQSNRQPEGDSPPSLSTVGTLLRERDETGETPNKLQNRASIAGATNFYASCTAIPLQRGIICPNLSRKRRGTLEGSGLLLGSRKIGIRPLKRKDEQWACLQQGNRVGDPFKRVSATSLAPGMQTLLPNEDPFRDRSPEATRGLIVSLSARGEGKLRIQVNHPERLPWRCSHGLSTGVAKALSESNFALALTSGCCSGDAAIPPYGARQRRSAYYASTFVTSRASL
jgi:hypothetical protein